MTTCALSQVVEIADRLFPFSEAESWDNCGIQVGDPRQPVTSIAFSLDPTPQTVQFAADHGCQLLIAHHPVLIEPIRSIIADTLPGRTLLSAASLGVAIVSLHTNLDAAAGGLNDELARVLGFEEVITPLPATCARVGRLPQPMDLDAFSQTVCQALQIPSVRVIGYQNRVIERVACAAGSGMKYLPEAVKRGADVFVTGDVRHSAALEALDLGVPVIDAGHFSTERIAVPLMSKKFGEEFERTGLEVSCVCCDVEAVPFIDLPTTQGGC